MRDGGVEKGRKDRLEDSIVGGNGSRVVSRGRVWRESAGVGGEVVPLGLLSSSEKRSEDVVVELSGSSGSRELEVDDEDGLQDEPPGDELLDGLSEDGLDEGEGREGDPVGEPLLVVGGSRRLESLDGEVSGESVTQNVGYGGSHSEGVEEDGNEKSGDESEEGVGLGNVSLSLEVSSELMLAELLVEGGDLSLHRVGSSLNDRVVENLLSDSLSLNLSSRSSVGSLHLRVLSGVGSLLGSGRVNGGRGGSGRGGGSSRSSGRVDDVRRVGSGSGRVVNGLRVGSLSVIHFELSERC